MKENLILDESLDFALKIISFCKEVEETKFFTLKEQIFSAGTSIGSNVTEAQSPASRKDFIHKMKIAAKEANETEYWFLLCRLSPFLPSPDEIMVEQLKSIQRILSKTISSSHRGN